jgi:FkbM family methyltransferase
MINLSKLSRAVFSGSMKGHFGQWAEDVLVRKLFPKNKVNGIYLDLGCYHPFTHSNTAYFWMKGWTGFNVDANPNTIKLFNKTRPNDCNIWSAIVPKVDYDNGVDEISLLLPYDADYSNGVAATGTVSNEVGSERGFDNTKIVPAKSISQIISEYKIGEVDYINLDIEGFDEIVLKEIDFSTLQPTVVTVEDYSKSLLELSASGITKLMGSNNYELVARAGPTSIFLKNK